MEPAGHAARIDEIDWPRETGVLADVLCSFDAATVAGEVLRDRCRCSSFYKVSEDELRIAIVKILGVRFYGSVVNWSAASSWASAVTSITRRQLRLPRARRPNVRVFAEKSKKAHAANSHVVTAEKMSRPPGRVPKGLPTAGFDFSRIPIQAKPAINTAGDQYEQEADRVAEQVMRVPESQLQRQCACGEGCSECQRDHPGQEHRGLQLKRVNGDTLGPTEAPPIVHEVLRSPGQPLDAATRAFMEPRFGHDFSRIRVHKDAAGARAAEAIHARAYTVGTRIVFENGLQDRALLAHELTHVVQQAG